MKKIAAVIFPDTVPSEQTLLPLVQVFQPVVYCQPVDEVQEDNEKGCHVDTDYVAHNFIERVFPAPLGANKERFVRLLSDLRHRGDDYTSQLKHLTLATMGKIGESGGGESKSSILAHLLGKHGIKGESSEKREMLLWQARLILKLAEFYDEDQRLIRQEIDKINDRERDLISDLRKEQEYSSHAVDQASSVPNAADKLQGLRMKAWARMFALGEDAPNNYSVLVTENIDAFDRLVEEYELVAVKSPEKKISLVVPAYTSKRSEMLTDMQKFSELTGELIRRINACIEGNVSDLGLENEWKNTVDQVFPAEKYGRMTLSLYGFQKISVPQLFLQSFGQVEDQRLLDSTDKDVSDILIGTLTAQ